MGGYGRSGYLSDVLIFDVIKIEITKVSEGFNFRFTSDNNQIALVGGNVIALVFDEDDIPCLIEWKKGQKNITVVHKYRRSEN